MSTNEMAEKVNKILITFANELGRYVATTSSNVIFEPASGMVKSSKNSFQDLDFKSWSLLKLFILHGLYAALNMLRASEKFCRHENN